MNTIITKADVNNARYAYDYSLKRLKDAREYLRLLENELKGVKLRGSHKSYQCYKASTTHLRRNHIEVIKSNFQECHANHTHWHELRSLESIQNKESNKQEILDQTLKSLTHKQLQVLKTYFKNNSK